jgi:hypothetical protein
MASLSASPTLLRAITILWVVLLAAHGPMLLNHGLFMDDWIVLKVRSDYVVDLDFMLNGAGHPIFFSYDYLANLSNHPVLVMQVLALIGIFFGAICLFLTATRLNLLNRAEAVGFALIVWTYPGYQLWAGKANAAYVFSFGLSFVGAWLLILAFNAIGMRRILLRIAVALVFFLSFALNSTMILYGFLMLGLLTAVWQSNRKEKSPAGRAFLSVWRCAIGYPELVVLPILYWGMLTFWFKRIGAYAGHYNMHLPTLPELMEGWRVFFLVGYWDVLKNAVKGALESRASFVLAALFIVIGFVLLRPKAQPSQTCAKSVALPLLLCPIVFLALSLPYLIAGLRPADHFYESRHLLLFGLPLALALLAVKRVMETLTGSSVAFALTLGSASIVSIAMLWNGYVRLQARELKQEAFFSHLASLARPPATVFAVNDGFLDYPSWHLPFGVPEVTGMLRLAWGDQPFLGFTLQTERPTILQEMEFLRTREGSAYRHIDPYGPQATISLQPSVAAAPNASLVWHYYACRLLARCDVPAFLKQLALITINVGPIAGITPLDDASQPAAAQTGNRN